MVFKNFKLIVIIRSIFLLATSLLLFYMLLNTELYATISILCAAIIYQIWALIHYVDKTNRDLSRFLLSIKHSDFSQTFSSLKRGGSYDDLQLAFDEVIKEFQQTRRDKEEHSHYLNTVVQHIGIGLIAFKPNGNIDLINNAAKKLFGVTRLKNIRVEGALNSKLVDAFYNISPGENALVKLEQPGEMMQISIYATEFKLRDQQIKLVSLQNISTELTEREMEAWQQLVRVLTHEIMNSITPISSLASTIKDMLPSGDQEKPIDSETLGDMHSAVDTIVKRSGGLLNFVDAYRNLTRIPTPNFQIIKVIGLFERIEQLISARDDAASIKFQRSIEPKELEINADPDLIEQVLLNLVTNAVQALEKIDNPIIELIGKIDYRSRALIQVADNGPGLNEEALEKVFIPFYTTKSEGTGIGLSLSRQIMHLHKGDITVTSQPMGRTEFTLRF
ncbi:MAG: GHKL domain-containing protein [candidate division Zixibacteria bacterium]|nr:GHKL domain-containing protein [candidate division Zixibacteria bacterium]